MRDDGQGSKIFKMLGIALPSFKQLKALFLDDHTTHVSE